MQELTIRISESSLIEFLRVLKTFKEVQIKSPREEIMELIKKIDNGEETLNPIDWDFYEKAIYASIADIAVSK